MGAAAPLSPSGLGTVCVIGYGNQGRAHALNLRESGATVCVTGRANSAALTLAAADGFGPCPLFDAVARADLVILAVPDQFHAAVWNEIEPRLPPTSIVGFLHGASVHFGQVARPPATPFVLVAPKGPGTTLRERFCEGRGIPAMVAVEAAPADIPRALACARGWATAIGCGRAGIIETTFRDEAVADIFGEQAILCGGLAVLMETSFQTLVDAGVAPEVAYIECIQELKQIGDLVYERGVAGMRRAISDTAEAGMDQASKALPVQALRTSLRALLGEVESGRFFEGFLRDAARGSPALRASREAQAASDLEQVGSRVRTMYFPPCMREDGSST